jgi:hypothetical protein
MSNYRTKNQVVTAAVEDEAGVDAAPTIGANAVALEAVTAPANGSTTATNEHRGTLDESAPIANGGTRGFQGTALLKGAGAEGAKPEAGVFYRACGMAENNLAAAVVGAVVAADPDTLELEAGDGNGVHVGMVVEVTSGAGVGQVRVIAVAAGDLVTVYPDWDTVPAAGDGYRVWAGTVYSPTSTGLQTLTINRFLRPAAAGGKAKLTRILGAAGTFNLSLGVREVGRSQFQMTGLLEEDQDVADPGKPANLQKAEACPFMGARVYLGGTLTKFNQFSMNYGGTVQAPDNPLDPMGYDPAGVVSRKVEGRINPPRGLNSARNTFAAWRDGLTMPLWLQWGTVPGRRVSLFYPGLSATSPGDEEDVQGYTHDGIAYQSATEDAGVFVLFS